MQMKPVDSSGKLEGSRWLYSLVCSGAFFAIATEALISLLLPLLALGKELSLIQLGVLVAMGSVGPIIFALPGGAFCDHFGDRMMMIISALGVAATSLSYTLVNEFSWLCGVAIVGGFFRGMCWVATQSYALRFISPERRQKFMGHFSFMAGMGMLVSPLCAGYLADHFGLASGFKFMAAWGGTIILVASLLPDVRGENSPKKPARKMTEVALASYRDAPGLLGRRIILIIMLFTLLRLAAASINGSFYPVHLDQVGISVILIGQLFALIHVGTSVGTLLAAPLSRLISAEWLLGLAVAVALASIAVVPLYSALIPIAICTFFHGLGQGISLPLILATIARNAKHDERGLALGIRSMFNRIGYLIVPVMLGAIAEASNLRVAFLVTASLLLLLTLICTIALIRTPQPMPENS